MKDRTNVTVSPLGFWVATNDKTKRKTTKRAKASNLTPLLGFMFTTPTVREDYAI